MTVPDPFDRFRDLFESASATGLTEPNAMVLSSADEEGRPSSRVVLLKHFDREGFVFYTNLESRKGREILARPDVSLNFFWREPKEQVCIFGRAERVSDAEADAYFATRDRNSQLGAWASRQSRPLASREHVGRGDLGLVRSWSRLQSAFPMCPAIRASRCARRSCRRGRRAGSSQIQNGGCVIVSPPERRVAGN